MNYEEDIKYWNNKINKKMASVDCPNCDRRLPTASLATFALWGSISIERRCPCEKFDFLHTPKDLDVKISPIREFYSFDCTYKNCRGRIKVDCNLPPGIYNCLCRQCKYEIHVSKTPKLVTAHPESPELVSPGSTLQA